MDIDELLDESDESDETETELERSQRNFAELLQELRVMQTGVQILFAFLLSLAVSGRFDDIDAFQRTVYVVDLLAAAAATGLIVAPVAHHRLRFRHKDKEHLVRSANRLALAALAVLGVALVAASFMVMSFVVTQRRKESRQQAWFLGRRSW